MMLTIRQGRSGFFRFLVFAILVLPSSAFSQASEEKNPSELFKTWSAHDSDYDGVLNSEDNCPNYYNPDQADKDGDGIGDVCESNRQPNPRFANGPKKSERMNKWPKSKVKVSDKKK